MLRCMANPVKKSPGSDLFSHTLADAVSSALRRFTFVFGMRTSGTASLQPPGDSLCARSISWDDCLGKTWLNVQSNPLTVAPSVYSEQALSVSKSLGYLDVVAQASQD